MELLVVIAIIGVLASVVTASLSAARKEGRDARRQQDLHQMQTALELYANANNGAYPASSGWDCQDCTGTYGSASFFTTNLVNPGYIAAWPNDPISVGSRASGNYGYLYSSNGVNYELLIYSTVENACEPKTLMRGNGSQTSYVACSDSSYSTDCPGNPGYTNSCP